MIKCIAMILAGLCAAGPALAEECPSDTPPDDSGQRRQLAKKWFTKGEALAKAGDDLAAMKAYQCSLTFVPHAFTAYNVGRLAEKIGDLDAAITSYGQYLTLAPDAQDAKEVSDRVEALKVRMAKVREEGDKSDGPPLDRLIDKTKEEGFLEPPVAGKPNLTEVPGAELSGQNRTRAEKYRIAAWVTVASGGVLMAGGLVSNLLARGQMDACRSDYKNGDQSGADSACSNATAFAYLSYGLIGVGAAAVATGAVLMFVHPRDSDGVAVRLLPEGGLALAWSGRY